MLELMARVKFETRQKLSNDGAQEGSGGQNSDGAGSQSLLEIIFN